MRAGEKVLVCLGAANRDPEVFVAPDRLDISRANSRQHLALATGAHNCAGYAIAEEVGRCLFGSLAEHCASLRVVGTVAWRDRVLLRGLAAAEIALDAA